MTLEFTYGDSGTPKGHALVYFDDSTHQSYYASYIVLLPVTVDVSKYVPPFLMNQVGDIGPDDMSAFAFPPAPEEVEGLVELKDLAKKREDDLIYGGTCNVGDVASSMVKVNDIVQEYLESYEMVNGVGLSVSIDEEELPELGHVNDVVYSLMSESDRLGELTKLVGRLQYAIESGEGILVEETESDIEALSNYLPTSYQIAALLKWVGSPEENSASIADLYLKRCFHLAREEYVELGKIEENITDLTGS
jgi:hypothetical protein